MSLSTMMTRMIPRTLHGTMHGATGPARNLPLSLMAAVRRSPLNLTAHDGLVLLHGHPAVLRLGLYAAADRLMAGEPVLCVEGARPFDPSLLSRLARINGVAPTTLLARLHRSRAFTCQEMERLIVEQLAPALHAHRARVVILSDLLATFYDETVPFEETLRLARGIFRALRTLAQRGYHLLALCPPPPAQALSDPRRQVLLEGLKTCADRLIRVEEDGSGLSLREEGPTDMPKTWRILRETLNEA